MTDYNSMKADECAHLMGIDDEYNNDVDRLSDELSKEIPQWAWDLSSTQCDKLVVLEAKIRIYKALLGGRDEP